MTLRAVNSLVGKGVVSTLFRERLVAGRETNESLQNQFPGLDEFDLAAIAQAVSICGQDFAKFAATIESYLDRQYPGPRTT